MTKTTVTGKIDFRRILGILLFQVGKIAEVTLIIFVFDYSSNS